MKPRTKAYLAITVLLSLLLSGCGGGSSDNPTSTNSYTGTQTPGDAWSWTVTRDSTGSGTFSAANNTTNKTYSGNVVTLANRFLQLSVTASSQAGAVGGTAYAIEFPGTALIAKPAGPNDSPVVAAGQGDCPGPASYNWIKMPNSNWDVTTDPAFGTAVTTGSTSAMAFSVVQYLLGGGQLASVNDNGACSNGVITTSRNVFAVTPSGVFIGDEGANGGVVGMQQPSSYIGTTAVLQQGRQFRGFVFMTHPPQGQDGVMPVWAETRGDNLITAGEYTDFANNVEDSCPGGDSCATFALNSETAPGQFVGTMYDVHAGQHPFTLMINQINGKYMVFGFSRLQAGNGPDLYPYLFLVMEQ